ncbi:uncharacterized protein [Miscanthus floridulus]|uniref:uncharacterized protein n=1 Tax=Miscanthus floridulus TaxID=154761 RepID=UPI0034575452
MYRTLLQFNIDNVALAQSGLGSLCRKEAFCSICGSGVCLSCCPNHKNLHHGVAPGAIVRICMTKDGAAVDARDIKVNAMGYNWQLIQRKMYAGRKYIMLHEPTQDRRNVDNCLQCRRLVKAKSDYCSVKCKALHRPFGQNTHVVNALLQCDFDQPEVRDRFCIICRRAYASAHCADHDLHHHEQAAAAAPAPPPEAIDE